MKEYFNGCIQLLLGIVLVILGGILVGTFMCIDNSICMICGIPCWIVGAILISVDIDKNCGDSYWW